MSSLEKGLRVIEVLAAEGEGIGVSEVARRCNLSKPTAHRFLISLVEYGYVNKAGTPPRYALNLKLWSLANAAFGNYDIRDIARPYMLQLCRAMNESVHLSMLQNDKMVFIDKIEADSAIQAVTTIGGTGPVHCLATGKAILAHLGDDYVDDQLGDLEGYTKATIRDKGKLKRELAKVRERGYAVARNEWHDNVVGIGAAILNGRGRLIAAIGVAGPTDRLDAAQVARFGPMVAHTGRQISQYFGRNYPAPDV